jgi:hypothetical protein
VAQGFAGRVRLRTFMGVIALAGALTCIDANAAALCKDGWWADVMLGSYHIHPYRQFDEFNPGAGLECWFKPQWGALTGYYRNSLNRPSFYAGAMYAPEFAHFRWIRLGLMGGVISGYNYGKFGIGGENNHTGPVLAPAVITRFGRFAVNFILIPPIPQDNLPFTVGFQAKYRFK